MKEISETVTLPGSWYSGAFLISGFNGSATFTASVPYDCDEDVEVKIKGIELKLGQTIEWCTPANAPDIGLPLAKVWKTKEGSAAANIIVTFPCGGGTQHGTIEDSYVTITKAMPC